MRFEQTIVIDFVDAILDVTIQMRATKQHFPKVCLLCCIMWLYHLSLWMKSFGVSIQMKGTEQFFPVVLFIMLYKAVLPGVGGFSGVTIQMKTAGSLPFYVWLTPWFIAERVSGNKSR